MARRTTVRSAREAAAAWLKAHGAADPTFRGAYFIGRAAALHGAAELPEHADLDLAVVLDAAALPPRRKLRHRGVLLEVSTFPWSAFAAFEPLAASYHLAAGLAEDTIVADPTGALRAMQRRVARSFRREAWVRRRCDDAARRVEALLAGVESGADWNERVTAWIFAAGVTTHVLLVAALANPTVRLRYLAVRRVLDAHGASAFYPLLLELLGCAGLRAARVAHHVDALAVAFDAAAAAGRTPFPFSSDVTPLARPIAIDGCRALVRSGDPREAVFWLLVSFARCDRILAADAPEAAERNAPAFAALLADVGVAGPADLRDRAARVRAALPGVRRAAETILAANPRVVRSR